MTLLVYGVAGRPFGEREEAEMLLLLAGWESPRRRKMKENAKAGYGPK